MKIDKIDYKKSKEKAKEIIWEQELELATALFVNILHKYRNIDKIKVATELLDKYIKKKINSKVSPTPFMRTILKM
jgi:hypothetical protein